MSKRMNGLVWTSMFAIALVAGCGGGGNAGPSVDAAAGSSARGGSGGSGVAGTTGTGGTAGAGGSGTAGAGSGTGGAAGSGGGAGAGGSGGAGGAEVCTALCTVGRMCCGGACVNLQNDPRNCGVCGKKCEGNTPYCGDGTCQLPPCGPLTDCIAGATCCGGNCCAADEICCQDQGPISVAPSCFKPTADEPTCPQGCAPQCKSDRKQKKNITPADTDAILKKVSRLPISNWTYTEEPAAVRHLGPMAQDFRDSFGLGDSDRSFHSVDAHGVALAAIQALERALSQQEQRIEKLERENRALERRLRTLDDHAREAGQRR
jgi:hypothetical protein